MSKSNLAHEIFNDLLSKVFKMMPLGLKSTSRVDRTVSTRSVQRRTPQRGVGLYVDTNLKTIFSGKALSFEKDDLKTLFEMKVDSEKLDFSDDSKWTLEKNGQFQNRKNGRLHNIRDNR